MLANMFHWLLRSHAPETEKHHIKNDFCTAHTLLLLLHFIRWTRLAYYSSVSSPICSGRKPLEI